MERRGFPEEVHAALLSPGSLVDLLWMLEIARCLRDLVQTASESPQYPGDRAIRSCRRVGACSQRPDAVRFQRTGGSRRARAWRLLELAGNLLQIPLRLSGIIADHPKKTVTQRVLGLRDQRGNDVLQAGIDLLQAAKDAT